MEYALIPPKQNSFALLAAKHEQSPVEANLPNHHLEQHMFVISPSMARSVGYDMKSVRLIEDAIPITFDKLANAKPKQIISLMKKLNRKRVWMSDNRVILKQTNASSRIRKQIKIYLDLPKTSYGCVL